MYITFLIQALSTKLYLSGQEPYDTKIVKCCQKSLVYYDQIDGFVSDATRVEGEENNQIELII